MFIDLARIYWAFQHSLPHDNVYFVTLPRFYVPLLLYTESENLGENSGAGSPFKLNI